MKKSIVLRIESVRRLIYQHEFKMNPHYDINPEIIIHVQTIGSEGRHRIKYEVEYISRLDYTLSLHDVFRSNTAIESTILLNSSIRSEDVV